MRLWHAALVLAVGSVTYLNALDNPLVFDDRLLLLENPRLSPDAKALKAALTEPGLTGGPIFAGHYRPVFMASLWINRWLFGETVVAYRLVNLLFHLGCALALGWLCYDLLRGRGWGEGRSRTVAAVASALFAVAPLHFSAIALVLKRNTSLSALLMLLSLLLVARAVRGPRVRLGSWAAAIACGAIAQFCKEDAAILPALVLLYGWVACLWGGRRRLALAVAASLAVVPLLFAALWFPAGVRPSTGASLGYLLAQPRVLAEYALAALQVDRLTVCIGIPPASWPPGTADLLALGAVALATGAAIWLGRRHRLVAFAAVWALLCLAPTSSIFPLRLTGDFVRVYLASAGVLLLLAVGLVALGERLSVRAGRVAPLVRWSAALLLVALFARGTLAVNARHGQRQLVWEHARARYPGSDLAAAGLCAVLSAGKALEQAQRVCEQAYALRPAPAVALSWVTVLGRRGRLEEAERVLTGARQRLGDSWRLGLAEGRLAWFQDQWDRAEQAYQGVLARSPGNVEARVYLADVRLQLGKPGARQLIAPLLANQANLREYPLLQQLQQRTR